MLRLADAERLEGSNPLHSYQLSLFFNKNKTVSYVKHTSSVYRSQVRVLAPAALSATGIAQLVRAIKKKKPYSFLPVLKSLMSGVA